MDSPPDDEAMAQMLGFSSFGGQDHPHKKRKYNPNADAAEIASSSHDQQQQNHRRGKGASTTGSNSTPLGTRTAVNAEEISLEDDEDGPGETLIASAPDSAPVSLPAQTLVRPAGLPERPAIGAGSAGSFGGSSRRAAKERHHNRNLDIDSSKPWYTDYYDSSSNQNPWQRLETSLGLQPLGTWMQRDHFPSTTA